MRRLSIAMKILVWMSLSTTIAIAQTINWPAFRGHNAEGVASGAASPDSWNVETGENIAWKIDVPGLAHASPVVWGDKLFLVTAVSTDTAKVSLKVGLYGDIGAAADTTEHTWEVHCYDKNSGKLLWRQVAHRGEPKIKRHTKATHANCTPATNGEVVVAFFGSEGLYCYDMDGKLKWKKDFGVLDSGFFWVLSAQWGFASSPIIYKDNVIVQCDVQKNEGFIAVLDLETGEERWRVPREEVPTWGTPTIYAGEQGEQIIVNGWKHIGAYSLKDGAEIWKLRGGGDIPTPTPVLGHGMAYITNAHGGLSPVYAVDLAAKGDISLAKGQTSNAHIKWSIQRGGNYMQTPIVHGDYLYTCRDNGVMTCFDAKTGEKKYQQRLGGGRTGFTASPVISDDKLYYSSEMGDIYVLKTGPEFEQLAVNEMGSITMASPAVSEGRLYFRTRNGLVAVGQP